MSPGVVEAARPELVGALVLGAYLFGSIPWGLWLVKAVKGIDVREVGSGNIGTTNVYRAAGKGMAALVLVLDALKGFLPCWLAVHFAMPEWAAVLAGAAAIVGHSKSIFLRFSGGKSVATGIGAVLALAPLAADITLAVFGAIFAATRMVSAGSIGAAIALPLVMWATGASTAYLLFGAAAAAYVVIRHRANIGRIKEGTEARL
jgi:glycerol-3-phosphate acyltransferase PlsY